MSKTSTAPKSDAKPTLTPEEQGALDAARALYAPGAKRYMTATADDVKAHGFVADRVLTHLLNGGAPATVLGMGVGNGQHDVVKVDGDRTTVLQAKRGATKAQMAQVLAHAPRAWDGERMAVLALALKARGVKPCGLTRALDAALSA